MKTLVALTTAVTAILLAAAPASSYGASDTSGMQTARPTVAIASSPLGKILVDGKGRTLYDFPPDKSMASTCYGACAALWPPLITSSKPVAGKGVRASLLGTTKRKDGKLEVTYNHHPLYYFVSDQKAGQTTGQGVDQFGAPWWVISAAGKEIHRG
jgi:predicted lipoprotein with Yx(FWY)xxD motif